MRALAGHGWRCEISEARPDVDAARRYDVLIGCGGDGTLHALAQIAAGGRWLLGVAPPFGTANILAHALGCPARPEAAADWLERAWQQGGMQLPLGVAETAAGRRYFLAIASVGYDAAIVAAIGEGMKRRWGKLAFAAQAAVAWQRYFPAPLTCDLAAKPLDGLIFSLTRFYGGRLRLGTPALGRPLILGTRGAPKLLPLQALALGSVGLEHAPGVTRLPGDAVTVVTPGRPLQLDGEACGVTPVRLGLEAGGIRFLVPR